MHTDKIEQTVSGRLAQPSPNYQRLRPSMTQAQREQTDRLREAVKESFVSHTDKVEPEFATLEAQILAAMASGSGKTTMVTRLWSDIHFATYYKS